jgi:antitoxin component of RelBE/YafQ-DinJ toxin-antitoxin module
MSSPNIVIRISKEDRILLENIARYYGVTQSDVIRIALKEFAKSHGFSQVDHRANDIEKKYAEVSGTASS